MQQYLQVRLIPQCFYNDVVQECGQCFPENVHILVLIGTQKFLYWRRALDAVTNYRPKTQTNKLKLTLANSSFLSDFCH